MLLTTKYNSAANVQKKKKLSFLSDTFSESLESYLSINTLQ